MKKTPAILLALLLLAACVGDSENQQPATTSQSATTDMTTTSLIPATTPPIGEAAEGDEPTNEGMSGSTGLEVVTDLVFRHADDWFPRVGEMDVIAPSSGGPWPVVVAFYGGLRTDFRFWMRPMAEAIASRDRVVFVPGFGVTSRIASSDSPLLEQFEVLRDEVACALVVAKANAESFGGDPENITVFGYSGGGNTAIMSALAPSTVPANCSETGPVVIPDAVVSVEADLLLGDATWDQFLEEDPEAFYSATPWRYADGSAEFPIHIMGVDNPQGYDRSVGDDPLASFVADRHVDIDLVAELTEMGLLDDGGFSIRDGLEWSYKALSEAGYEATWTLLPDSRHATLMDSQWALSDESWELVVETVLNADGTGTLSLSLQDWEGMEGYRLLAIAWSEQDEVLGGLSGAAFWTRVDTDPFSSQDVIHPPAIPNDIGLPWAEGDYLWNETARLQPGTYGIELYANPGELNPYGKYIPAEPIERRCWIDVEVRAGETSTVVISELPLGDGPCPLAVGPSAVATTHPASSSPEEVFFSPAEPPLSISTVVGDLEFAKLGAPGQTDWGIYVPESTPYGLVALEGDTLWWSTDYLSWKSAHVPFSASRVSVVGKDVVVHGDQVTARWVWNGEAWAEASQLDIGGVQLIAAGPRGTIAATYDKVLYSSDGQEFTEASSPPRADALVLAGEPKERWGGMAGGCSLGIYTLDFADSGVGSLLPTPDGFVVLTAAHPLDWGDAKICEPIPWFSSDGDKWVQVATKSPFGEDAAVLPKVTERDGRFVAVGHTDPDSAAIWVSDDALSWRQVDLDIQIIDAVGAGELGWMITGALLLDAEEEDWCQVMFFSADGLTWDGPHDRPDGLKSAYMPPQLAVGPDAFFGIGGSWGPVLGRLTSQAGSG
ncbi:MAG: carboxylesterase family protein [Acidimicrobiia bacterium]|nr:carboxylesterase family protein [Acidimicrobiia bacterium]